MMLRLRCPLGEMIRRSRTGRRTARDQRWRFADADDGHGDGGHFGHVRASCPATSSIATFIDAASS